MVTEYKESVTQCKCCFNIIVYNKTPLELYFLFQANLNNILNNILLIIQYNTTLDNELKERKTILYNRMLENRIILILKY